MKLEHLFALYLYQNKKLNLPGIGAFTADKIVAVPDDNEKHPMTVEGITFINKNITVPDDDFIEFIKTHTGKMKPLAISDLESYLMLSKQFLNIGKPFYIEGVGTLQKVNDGSLKFTPGEYASTRLEAPAAEKNMAEKKTKAMFPEEHREYKVGNNVSKKILVLLLAIATILLVGWGGYYLFKSNTGGDNTSGLAMDTIPEMNALPQNNTMQVLQDSSHILKDSASNSFPGSYKYILETAGKKRALKRFAALKSLKNGIQMETKDSVLYNIYLIRQSAPSDTTRLKDSLNLWYYGNKVMKVKIQP